MWARVGEVLACHPDMSDADRRDLASAHRTTSWWTRVWSAGCTGAEGAAGQGLTTVSSEERAGTRPEEGRAVLSLRRHTVGLLSRNPAIGQLWMVQATLSPGPWGAPSSVQAFLGRAGATSRAAAEVTFQKYQAGSLAPHLAIPRRVPRPLDAACL